VGAELKPYYEEDNIQIYCGDCLEILPFLNTTLIFAKKQVDLVVTSPPYNKGYYDKHKPHPTDAWKQRNISYGDFKDNLLPEEYIKQQIKVISELVLLIKESGSIFYNTKSVIANHKLVYPTFVFDFNVRQQIIWDRNSTPQLAPIRFFPTTEYIFWITKGQVQPKFYRRGKFDKEVWRINPKPMKEHSAPFPLELVNQCILSTTDKNDLVLDPFLGSGTTLVACKELGRKGIGIEINKEYCNIAIKRLKNTVKDMFL